MSNRVGAVIDWVGQHPRARRAGGIALTVLVAAAGTIGLLAFFVARDTAPVSSSSTPITGAEFPNLGSRHLPPGSHARVRYNTDPPTSGPHVVAPVRRDRTALTNDQILTLLEQGNVVLVYSTPQPPQALVAVAQDEAGVYDPALASAGQAVALAHGRRAVLTRGHARRSRRSRRPLIVGLAWRHVAVFRTPQGPALRNFVRYWLDH